MTIFQNVGFRLGEDWAIDFVFTDGDGAPMDLSAATVELRIAKGAVLAIKTDNTGGGAITVTDAPGGAGFVRLTPDQQTEVAPGVYAYEFWVQQANQNDSMPAAGNFTVSPGLKPKFP